MFKVAKTIDKILSFYNLNVAENSVHRMPRIHTFFINFLSVRLFSFSSFNTLLRLEHGNFGPLFRHM